MRRPRNIATEVLEYTLSFVGSSESRSEEETRMAENLFADMHIFMPMVRLLFCQ